MKKAKRLTPKMVSYRVIQKLRRYEKLSFLEQYAMFMGKAQIIEASLKEMLQTKYRLRENRLEKMTLGTAICELEKAGLRKDFISLLWQLNEFRVRLAHEFLVETAIMNKLTKNLHSHFSWKTLDRALFKIEETILVRDFLFENNYIYNKQDTKTKDK